MSRAEPPPSVQLRRLVAGYQVTQAIHVAATLGIADLLADGPRTSDELARATAAHTDALYRLLRALASVGVLHEEDGRRFTLTPLGEGLRSEAPDSLAGWAAFVGRPYYWSAWSSLEHSVRTGENAFRAVHGTDVWEYRSQRTDESAIFDRAMMALTRGVNRSVLDAYDFGRFATVVDVGGGNGTLLAALLAEYPQLHGVLFDQPHVVAGAPEVFADVAERCQVVGGSFFEAVPAGGDAYVLKSIVHDWEDAEATAILRVCRVAMAAGAALLVIERELGPPNEAPEAKFGDLNMLVAPGGRERTLAEYGRLFADAGFERGSATPTASGVTVIEAVAA
jgi:O-methyltransferase/methyltransferase family protein